MATPVASSLGFKLLIVGGVLSRVTPAAPKKANLPVVLVLLMLTLCNVLALLGVNLNPNSLMSLVMPADEPRADALGVLTFRVLDK